MAHNDPWISVTNATHYVLDGIPMRIAENFRPKKKSTELLPHPLRFNPAQSKVLDDNVTYTYDVENGFVSWYNDMQESQELAKREKQEAEDQRKKNEAEEKAAATAATAAAATESATSATAAAAAGSPAPGAVPATSVITQQPVKREPNLPTVTDSILLPQRGSPITTSSTANDQSHPVANVNISDFENLGEDPFDNMELKTINDMKELETVLANSQRLLPQVAESKTDTINPSTVPKSIDVNGHTDDIYQNIHETQNGGQEPIYGNVTENGSQEATYSNVALTLAGPTSTPQNNLHKQKAPLATPRVSLHSAAALTNNLSKDPAPSAQFNSRSEQVNIGRNRQCALTTSSNIPVKDGPAIAPPPVKPKPVKHPQATSNKYSGSLDTASQQNTSVQSLANALAANLGSAASRPPGAPKGFSYVTPVNGTRVDSKEVKDVEWPSMDSLPPTPQGDGPSNDVVAPPFASGEASKVSQNAPQNSASKASSQTQNRNSMPIPLEIPPSQSKPAPGEVLQRKDKLRAPPPRPTSAPSKSASKPVNKQPAKSAAPATDDQVIDSLISMGFDRTQITSSMMHIGSDTKKLVDHLCAVQHVASKDVKWQTAQQAVFMSGQDPAKTEKFAKAYQQLLEFGFGDDKIKEALISCDADVQKALDRLVP